MTAPQVPSDDSSEEVEFRVSEQESALVAAGTANTIDIVEKQRVLDRLPEVLRVKVHLRDVLGVMRGANFVRHRAEQGEDFFYILILHTVDSDKHSVTAFLQRIATFLIHRFGIDIEPLDLRLELFGGEPISPGYSLLEVIFVAATSPQRDVHLLDDRKLLVLQLNYHPRIEGLSSLGALVV